MLLIIVLSGIFYVSTLIYSTGAFKGILLGIFKVELAADYLSILG